MNNSNWTGRTSRTLNEAFGAHCSQSISDPYQPMQTRDKAFVAAVVCVFVLWVALMAVGVIK